MKVFFVNSNKMWGGGEKWHLEAACAMRDRGHETAILTLKGKDLFQRARAAGIRTLPVVVSNTSFLNPWRIIPMVRLLREEKPDIIVLNFSADIKTIGLSAKLANIQNIVYRRGSSHPIRNTPFNRFLYRHIITHLIANSRETLRSVLQNNAHLVEPDRIDIICNGINLRQFDKTPVTELYKRKGHEVIIGNAGRLVKLKGHKYLIDMAVMLKKKNIDFVILVAGKGPYEPVLKQLALDAGVEDRVLFLGFVHNMKAFMENIDIFAFTSEGEGFGFVLIEAMACIKPVVAFNNTCIPEIIIDHETGLYARNGDLEDLTQKIETMIIDPELRQAFGQAGRKRVEDLFELEKIHSHVEDVFLRLIREKKTDHV